MHAVFFGIKRVHLQVVAVTRSLLNKSGLTPARFDMMRIIELHRRWGVAQMKIQDVLGVSAPTVSRMLKALEELGYVVRERMDHDARMRRVYITELGLEVVRAQIVALIDTRANERMALRGLDYYRKTARRKLERLRKFLSSMRKIYGDAAAFEHPWTTDDLLPPLVFTTMVDGRLCYGAPFEIS